MEEAINFIDTAPWPLLVFFGVWGVFMIAVALGICCRARRSWRDRRPPLVLKTRWPDRGENYESHGGE
jgi:hypothetical protein